MKKAQKLLSFIMLFALIAGMFTVAPARQVKAASKGITVGGTYDTDKVEEFTSAGELMEAVSMDEVSPVAKLQKGETVSLKAEEDGCIILQIPNAVSSYPKYVRYSVYSDSSLSTTAKLGCETAINQKREDSYSAKAMYYAIKKGETLYIKCTISDGDSAKVIAGFIPNSKMFSVEGVSKESDGYVVKFKAGNKKAKLDIAASENSVSYSAYREKGGSMFPMAGIMGKGSAEITVPKADEYTFRIAIREDSDTYCTIGLITLDINDYLKSGKSDKDSKSTKETAEDSKSIESICCVIGTNVVAGIATPSTKVTVKIGKKEYSTTSDANGFYYVKTSKLKKDSKVSVYEGKDSKSAVSVKPTKK